MVEETYEYMKSGIQAIFEEFYATTKDNLKVATLNQQSAKSIIQDKLKIFLDSQHEQELPAFVFKSDEYYYIVSILTFLETEETMICQYHQEKRICRFLLIDLNGLSDFINELDKDFVLAIKSPSNNHIKYVTYSALLEETSSIYPFNDILDEALHKIAEECVK